MTGVPEPARRPFVTGDVVRLRRHGSPHRVVEHVDDAGVHCAWIDDRGNFHRRQRPPLELVLVEPFDQAAHDAGVSRANAQVVMSNVKIEPIRDGRCIIDGIVYALSVIEIVRSHDPESVGNRDVSMECTRCGARWSKRVTRSDLEAIYVRIPSRSSPMTLLNRAPQVKHAVLEWSGGHLCMPRGYANIPSNVLRRIDRSATKAEQYEALSTMLGELAIAEGV